jgi:hypothetical protein
MRAPRLPHPNYPIGKYNSKRLLRWLEECELRRLTMWSGYGKTTGEAASGYYRAACDCAALGADIYEKLLARGLSAEARNAIVQTAEDFNS